MNAPVRLVAIIRSQSAGSSVSRLRLRTFVPALQTSTSIDPNVAEHALDHRLDLAAVGHVASDGHAFGIGILEALPRTFECVVATADQGERNAGLIQGPARWPDRCRCPRPVINAV